MAIYTGEGDSGDSSLIGNIKKPKDSSIFDVLGTLDEFNSTLGVLLAEIDFSNEARKFIVELQKDLLKIGSLLANSKTATKDFVWLKDRVKTMEMYIDELAVNLSTLNNFVLPGGSKAGAKIHLSRAVCRRLERTLVHYFSSHNVGSKYVLQFVNRLSDLLFVLARFLNLNENVEDVIWTGTNE